MVFFADGHTKPTLQIPGICRFINAQHRFDIVTTPKMIKVKLL